jgi:hypothetical protein
MSLYFLLFAGTTPLGGMLVGVLAAHAGVQPTVVFLGLACLLGIAGTAYLAWRLSDRGARIPTPREHAHLQGLPLARE